MAQTILPFSSTPTRNTRGSFARRATQRLSQENLIFRAQLLPTNSRNLLLAHLDFGMRAADLAALHNIPATQLARKLHRLRDTLSDPAFLLAAKFSHRLPTELRLLATHHWVDGQTLRELADRRQQTIHSIRQELATARALLLLEAKNETKVDVASARNLLEGIPPAKRRSA